MNRAATNICGVKRKLDACYNSVVARVLMVSSEAAPLAKTGGLADVVGALPSALRSFGNEVAVFTEVVNALRALAEPQPMKPPEEEGLRY